MDNFAENVSKHFGLPWTSLIDHCRKTKKEKPPDVGGTARIHTPKSTSMTSKLQEKDAPTFAFRPALDECLLTLCDKCSAVIKPQALKSHIVRRHKDPSDETTVQHLATERPIIKGHASKSKSKSSPRNSPKPSSTHEGNLLDKYKLPPKPPVGHNAASGKFPPGSLEKSNSAIARHLSRASAQPVISLDDVGPRLNSSKFNASPSSSCKHESLDSRASKSSTPTTNSEKISQSTPSTSNGPINGGSSKKSHSKRTLDMSASDSVSSPKKPKIPSSPVVPGSPQTQFKTVPPLRLSSKGSPGTLAVVKSSVPLSPEEIQLMTSPNVVKSEPDTEIIGSLFSISAKEKKECKEPNLQHITTTDKNIPCKDREYDPDRHCGCWLEDWGKHCTRSLTCKSHALSLRRRVSGRSKPFDQLLQEHREAKEALLRSKLLSEGKLPNKASTHGDAPHKHEMGSNHQGSKTSGFLMDVDIEESPAMRLQSEYLGHSSFHPRPLAAPSYGARMCGNSYVPNRQLDFLRFAIKTAMDQPKPTKKSCSSKTKSVNGASNQDQTTSGSQYKSQLPAKRKSSTDNRKKKVKRMSGDSSDHPIKSSPPFSHRMSSPICMSPSLSMTISSPPPHQQLYSQSSNQQTAPSPSAHSSVSQHAISHRQQSPTVSVLSNGASQPYYRANVLKDLGIRASMQKVAQTDQLTSPTSLHLTTNSSGIATLNNKHNYVLDGLQYALYNTSGAKTNEQGLQTAQPVLVKGSDLLARNGVVMHSPVDGNTTSQPRLENQPTLLEIIPKSSNHGSSIQHQQRSGIHYMKAQHLPEGQNFTTSNQAGDKLQQLTIANGTTMAAFSSQVRAMQIKHQQTAISKPANVSLTIPLVTQPAMAQQQAIHNTSGTKANQGFTL